MQPKGMYHAWDAQNFEVANRSYETSLSFGF